MRKPELNASKLNAAIRFLLACVQRERRRNFIYTSQKLKIMCPSHLLLSVSQNSLRIGGFSGETDEFSLSGGGLAE